MWTLQMICTHTVLEKKKHVQRGVHSVKVYTPATKWAKSFAMLWFWGYFTKLVSHMTNFHKYDFVYNMIQQDLLLCVQY